jgi:hypothetical protein
MLLISKVHWYDSGPSEVKLFLSRNRKESRRWDRPKGHINSQAIEIKGVMLLLTAGTAFVRYPGSFTQVKCRISDRHLPNASRGKGLGLARQGCISQGVTRKRHSRM